MLISETRRQKTGKTQNYNCKSLDKNSIFAKQIGLFILIQLGYESKILDFRLPESSGFSQKNAILACTHLGCQFYWPTQGTDRRTASATRLLE